MDCLFLPSPPHPYVEHGMPWFSEWRSGGQVRRGFLRNTSRVSALIKGTGGGGEFPGLSLAVGKPALERKLPAPEAAPSGLAGLQGCGCVAAGAAVRG